MNISPTPSGFTQSPSPLGGYYVFTIGTTNDAGWRAGDYVFAVVVKTKLRGGVAAEGRTLASLHIPFQ